MMTQHLPEDLWAETHLLTINQEGRWQVTTLTEGDYTTQSFDRGSTMAVHPVIPIPSMLSISIGWKSFKGNRGYH